MKKPALIVVVLLASCTEITEVPIGTQLEGDSCDLISDCQAGLTCDGGTCRPLPPIDTAGREGEGCGVDGDCRPGLCCGGQGVCRTLIDGSCGLPVGSTCGLSADCAPDLICNGDGVCVAPGSGPGEGEEGDVCEDTRDCRRPLICGATDTCQPPPFFSGVNCDDSENELGSFRAFFEVPPLGGQLREFFRQPFPSDVRLRDGKIDLTGHPSPGNVVGIDFDEAYLRAIEEDRAGFGLTQPIFVRFTDPLDAATLTINEELATVRLVNIDADSAEFGEVVKIQLNYESDRSLFICESTIAVAPVDGLSLLPSTTYALIVGSDVRDFQDQSPIQDGDFAMMLENATPDGSRPELAAAHTAYAPLRAFLTSEGIAAESLAIAAVFTTGDPGAIAPKVREAVLAAPAPTASDLTRCGTGATSPCAEGAELDCPGAEPATHHEFHLRVSNPVIQAGLRPYVTLGNGAIETDASGAVTIQGSEDVCVAVAVPRAGAMPADGWPVVIYAHGTGGRFTSGMEQIAPMLTAQGIAVVSFDGVMHGSRQELPPVARQDPGRLFFNVPNPRAGRDNVLQGAADAVNLERWIRTFEIDDGGLVARFDGAFVSYYGHSQGTVVGAPYIGLADGLRSAVFTGAGAEIGLSLVFKQKPNDVSALTRALFGDQNITRLHPMIGIMSLFFGPSDAIPYAAAFGDELDPARAPFDFLHVFGLDDGFTPDVTQDALVRAGQYPIVGDVLRPVMESRSVPSPASANLRGRTLGALQYPPDLEQYDGHFVGTRNSDAVQAIETFLRDASTDAAPARIMR